MAAIFQISVFSVFSFVDKCWPCGHLRFNGCFDCDLWLASFPWFSSSTCTEQILWDMDWHTICIKWNWANLVDVCTVMPLRCCGITLSPADDLHYQTLHLCWRSCPLCFSICASSLLYHHSFMYFLILMCKSSKYLAYNVRSRLFMHTVLLWSFVYDNWLSSY